jgi:hypothetical protein
MEISAQVSSLISRITSVLIFDYVVRFFLIFIPFSSFISVFLVHKIGITGASFIKELILVIWWIALLYTYIQSYFWNKKYLLKISTIDILIFLYIILFVGITIMTTGIQGMIYGGRYDFSFLLVFLLAYHGFPLLQKPVSYYIRIFLLSAWSMLFISGLLKWPLNEDLLLFFGYSGNPSAWDFGWAPPIFHGIDGANVRRFQWLLDGPNTMGAFLIIVSGIFAYFVRFRRDWYFVISIILLGLFGMVFYTYSRSALIGMVFAYVIVVVMSLRSLWHLYRMQLISVFLILGLFASMIGILYYDKALAIVGRAWSTQWHMERMMIWVHRVMEHPFGQWLWSAGPGYRYVMDLWGKNHFEVAKLDTYYIPESWYIQQFIEWWIVGGILFIGIMAYFFFALLTIHPLLGALFAGIGTMNLFLHTFESSIVSLSLFFLVGIFLAHKKNAKK